MNIKYSTGEPEKSGVYACRIESVEQVFIEDKFLIWNKVNWIYPRSDQKFRGEVLGWLGPLPREW